LTVGETTHATVLEYEAKAGFLYNFLKFVTWPDEKDLGTDDWQIGVIADENVVNTIRETLVQKRVAGRHIAVSAIEACENMEKYHVMFVAGNYMDVSTSLIAELKNFPVLVVGEVPEFAGVHGIIGFVKREDILRLEINPLRARTAGLIISHKLASLGELVDDKS